MRAASRVFLVFFLMFVSFAIAGIAVFGSSPGAQTLNLPESPSGAVPDDDDVPEVTARVARISFVKGDAKIKRAATSDWENVTLNLPVVEGDEIVTEVNGRVEIQFDKYQHLRLSESSLLKIETLKDEGIAVSLSLGTLNVRITSFNKDRSYFEIDAPKTTVAVQHSGAYRVDAGSEGDNEIRVSSTEGGEARVYSDNAGFTLKNGRSARVYIAGANVGEWETSDASRISDDFGDWVAERDFIIAKQLKAAYYDKYYDNDIYGADDLNDYGEWVNTRNYGYVWRPYRTSLSRYVDWSPYRYGHWRWMQPYGWIWVNDEPWGWATYHHGRWFYDDGYWNWSPYGYYRPARSWWFPALVVINVFNNNVCWYPLPYYRRHHNYNWNQNNHNGGNHPGGGPRPRPTPTPGGTVTAGIKPIRPPGRQTIIPPSAVITTPRDEFGTGIKGPRRPPLSVANAVLAETAAEVTVATALPSYSEVSRKIGRDIRTASPRVAMAESEVATGAAPRNQAAPLDTELRTKRIFGGRPPVTGNNETDGINPSENGTTVKRKTGAVDRPVIVKERTENAPIKQTTIYTPPIRSDDEPQKEPVKTPRYETTPRPQPPPVKEQPRYETTPRPQPPPVKEQPRYENTPRPQPPVKEQPRNEPRPRQEPPPPKSQPKPETGPAENRDRKKDGK